jgi:hypothetical protein
MKLEPNESRSPRKVRKNRIKAGVPIDRLEYDRLIAELDELRSKWR